MTDAATQETMTADELEWRALESAGKTDGYWGPRGWLALTPGWQHSGVPYSNRPHPDSYGADVPMAAQSLAQLNRTTAKDRRQLAMRPLLVKMAPAPVSQLQPGAAYPKYRMQEDARRLAELEKKRAKVEARAAELSFLLSY